MAGVHEMWAEKDGLRSKTVEVTVAGRYQVVYNFTLYGEEAQWNETEHYVYEPPERRDVAAVEIPVNIFTGKYTYFTGKYTYFYW